MPEPIVRKIQQTDRIFAQSGHMGVVLRESEIAEATYGRRLIHYGGLNADEANKLNQLAKPNHSFKYR